MTDKVSLIKAEINLVKDAHAKINSIPDRLAVQICDNLLSFIESLPEDNIIYKQAFCHYGMEKNCGFLMEESGELMSAVPHNIALRNCTVVNDSERKQFMMELQANGYKWDEDKMWIVCNSESSGLTVFEAFLKLIVNLYCQKVGQKVEYTMTDDGAKKYAKRLLSIARKQFIEEACNWLNENLTNNPSGKLCATFGGAVAKGKFIEYFRKALEKGGKE